MSPWAETDSCSGNMNTHVFEEIVLEGFTIDSSSLAPGDTVLIAALLDKRRWRLNSDCLLRWTVRFDTDFDKGPFYRKWYGKQYRRRLERRRGELYRYTVSGRLAGDGRQPDMWKAGEKVRQDIRIVIPYGMADGDYIVTVSVERRAYLPNRNIRDYFLNEDSFSGHPVGRVTIRK